MNEPFTTVNAESVNTEVQGFVKDAFSAHKKVRLGDSWRGNRGGERGGEGRQSNSRMIPAAQSKGNQPGIPLRTCFFFFQGASDLSAYFLPAHVSYGR